MSSNVPDEGELDRLERQFPTASGAAFSHAYEQALQAGLSVMVSDDGAIYEVFPDGRRSLVKEIARSISTRVGLKIKLR